MRKENRIRREVLPNQVFIIYRRKVGSAPRRELCHTRDSGAVVIAPLVRRSAAIQLRAALSRSRTAELICCLGETPGLHLHSGSDGRRTTRMVLESDLPPSRGVVPLSAKIHVRGGRHRGSGARDLRSGLRPLLYPGGRFAARVVISHCP